MSKKHLNIKAKHYWNPYLTGVLLGLVLLVSFIVSARGLGASGVASQAIAHSAMSVNLENDYLRTQISNNTLWESWIFIEVIGIFLGAFISAKLSFRSKVEMLKGKGVSNFKRIVMALCGGFLMGFAARLARGCTSGQALTGGALLSMGSWLFMLAIFIGAYLTIIFFKRNWL